MKLKTQIIKVALTLLFGLIISETKAQDTLILRDTIILNIENPLYIKGCGQAGNGVVSIIGLRFHVNCPYCCQGKLWGSATAPAHICNIPEDQCAITSPQYIVGPCPACLEIVAGMVPGGGGILGYQITVYSVGRKWWVTGLTGTISPGGDTIIEGDIVGPIEGEEILP